jgi:hypothetical protein
MQSRHSEPVAAHAFSRAPVKTAACEQCGTALGEHRILTRDAHGFIRRFCPDTACIEAWRCHHCTAFR